MYNYQTYSKEQQLRQKLEAISKDHTRTGLHREKSSPTLVHAHKKRIEGFILSMIDKPIVVSQHSNSPHRYRDQDNRKNLGSDTLQIKHHTQAQRLQQVREQNSIYDEVPFNNTFSHRFKEYDSASKPMKYKPSIQSLRIKEYFDQQSLNYLPNYESVKLDRLVNRTQVKKSIGRDSLALTKTINKSLLPMLHNKTYFKSVTTLFAELPKNWKEGSVYEKQATQQNYQQGQAQVKRQSKKTNDHMSRKQNSREALIKCHMLATRDHSSLYKSQSGHTSSFRA